MGDVVVHELSPLHHVVGVQLTGSVHIRDDVDADQAGRGEGGAGLGHLRPPHAVTVLGQETPLEWSPGCTPERSPEVVTGPVIAPEDLSRVTGTSPRTFLTKDRVLQAKSLQAESRLIRRQRKSKAIN